MRDIKFRAWCVLEGKGSFIYYSLSERNTFNFEIFDQEEINQQFTGVLDRNKKEIYEGDIWESPSGRICKISWISEIDGHDWTGWNIGYDQSMSDGKIIGNIFENPDLK